MEHKAEQDKIIYEDKDEKTGFIIVNDLKWDGQPNTLKLIALPFQKIRSIRELNAFHLPLLKNIREAGTAVIAKKFNISASQLRIYLHYQPSYYYLHVHFAYLMFETPGKFKIYFLIFMNFLFIFILWNKIWNNLWSIKCSFYDNKY